MPKRAKAVDAIAVVVAVVCVVVAAAYAVKFVEDQRQPDYQTMRKYVVSRLSDEQIRAAAAQAKLAFTQAQAESNAQWEKDRRDNSSKLAKCNADPAYRERQGAYGCSTPLGYAMGVNDEPKIPTEEQDYDIILMGRCMFVGTIQEAKKAGCLPP